MPKVQLNTPSPDFTLANYDGQSYSLSDFRNEKHVLLIFNRGFV